MVSLMKITWYETSKTEDYVLDIYVDIGWDINKARMSLWSVHCKYGNSLYIVYVMN
jgi:hypothetical protein